MRGAKYDAGPVGDQCLRGSEPKTTAAAGHEVNPVAQSKVHPAILPGAPVSRAGSGSAGHRCAAGVQYRRLQLDLITMGRFGLRSGAVAAEKVMSNDEVVGYSAGLAVPA